MLFRIDPQAAEPLFAQIATHVRLAIARGELKSGNRLPAARELAAALDLNMHTVLRAYQELREEGLLDLRRGRGAVITPKADANFADLHGALAAVVREARALNLTQETTSALLREEFR